MRAIQIIKTARRIHKFERRQNATVTQLLERMVDPTFLDRATKPEPLMNIASRGYEIAMKQNRQKVYSENRKVIQ